MRTHREPRFWTYRTQNDRPRRTTDSAISTGDNHLTATAAAALPATPSRANAAGMIHHHGRAAASDAATANRLRNLSTSDLSLLKRAPGPVPDNENRR